MLQAHRILAGLTIAALFAAAVPRGIAADEAGIDVGQPKLIVLEPASFVLSGNRAQQQLIVTGRYEGELIRDLTLAAEFVSSDPKVVTIDSTIAKPVGDGAAKITAKVAGVESTIDVTVKGMQLPSPVELQD